MKDIRGKRVLVRGDIDVPVSWLESQQVSRLEDESRLENIWPTIQLLLENQNTVILCGHLGRPQGIFDEKFSVKPVVDWLCKQVSGLEGQPVSSWIDGRFHGFEIDKNLIVLENLRFFPEEEANDPKFAQELASLAEVYVNEAFATCERAHASIVGVPKLLPHYLGLRLQKEIEVLTKVLKNPVRPLLTIIGGAKIETKQPLIDKMKNFADAVVIGGLLATKEKDFVVETIPQAKTIVWNGLFGEVETGHDLGTRKLVDLILSQKEAYKIVGGGDTVGFLQQNNLLAGFDFVSSGGGSMLKFLSGEKLPGIEVLLAGQ